MHKLRKLNVPTLLILFHVISQGSCKNKPIWVKPIEPSPRALMEPETRQLVLPYERAFPIRECAKCTKGVGPTACMAGNQCRPIGTKCSDLPEFFGSKVVTVARHYCKNDDGSAGVSHYCCDQGSKEALNIYTIGARPNQFPFMVYVTMTFKRSDNGDTIMAACGGTIINKDWILTATHCVTPSNATDDKGQETNVTTTFASAQVLVGQNHIYGGPERAKNLYNVQTVISYPGFTYQNLKDDITLLKLDRSLDLTGPFVQAMPLPDSNFIAQGLAEVQGWGLSDGGTALPLGTLLGTTLAIVDNAQCEYLTRQAKPATQLCLGGGEDAIPNHGDSGGGAICRDSNNSQVVCGIASFIQNNVNCKNGDAQKLNGEDELPPGCVYEPAVYTRVSMYRDWINTNMK